MPQFDTRTVQVLAEQTGVDAATIQRRISALYASYAKWLLIALTFMFLFAWFPRERANTAAARKLCGGWSLYTNDGMFIE